MLFIFGTGRRGILTGGPGRCGGGAERPAGRGPGSGERARTVLRSHRVSLYPNLQASQSVRSVVALKGHGDRRVTP